MIKGKKFSLITLITVLFVCIACFLGTTLSNKKGNVANAYTNADVKAYGVDISTWQGSIDYGQLASQVDFVIIRIGYSTGLDSRFGDNINGCLNAGIPTGIYIYSLADSTGEAVDEANWVVSTLNSYGCQGRLSYPVYFDYEETGSISSRSRETNTAIVNAFADTVSAGGYYPGVYMGGSNYNSYINSGDLNCDAWVAAYMYTNDVSTFWNRYGDGKITMWQWDDGQYCSASKSAGTLGCSSSSVDQDYCFVDYPSIIGNGTGRWTSDNGTYTITQGDSHIETSGWENGTKVGNPFCLLTNQNSSNFTYAVKAVFHNTDATPMETLEYGTVKMGFCPYYKNADNFILIYMYWAKDVSTSRMRSVEANICHNGEWADVTIAWVHDVESLSGLWHNSNWSNGYSLHCDVSKKAVRVMINDIYVGYIQTGDYFDSLVSGSKIGLYSWWSSTMVTDVGTWDVSYWNNSGSTYTIDVNDAVEGEWTQGNFCDMSIFNEVATESTYYTSAKFTVNNKVGEVQKFGYCPMYLDENNYILVFLKWDSTVAENKIVSVEFSGKEQGNAIYGSGYYTCWVHDYEGNSALQVPCEGTFTIKCKLETDGITVWVNDNLVKDVDGNSKISLTGYSGGLTCNYGRFTLFSFGAGVTVSDIKYSKTDFGTSSGTTGGTTGGENTPSNPTEETKTFTIKFNKNSGKGTMTNLIVTTGVNTKLTKNKFTREGYIFKGWSTSSTGEVIYTDAQSIQDIASSGSTVTLYAIWEEAETNTEDETTDANTSDSQASCSMSADFTSFGAILLLVVSAFLIIKKKALNK